MPVKSRNGEKFHRIIAAATKVFAKKGFFHAKVSDIAREAQVADGTIYLYFENKDDILISLFEEQMKAVLENMVRQVSEERTLPPRLEDLPSPTCASLNTTRTWRKSSRSSCGRAASS
jgi:TetR/AcrR family transcriptional regulator, fatty acid metabolism regulator protein